MSLHAIPPPALWIGFFAFVVAMLFLDFRVFHRKAHAVKMREAALLSLFWVSLAVAFNVGVGLYFNWDKATQFLTAYLTEYALSVDNLFVFLVIFQYFAVPEEAKHRVLFWGILGAVLMRLAFILVGTALLERFHCMAYLFGAFLLLTGGKLLFKGEGEVHPDRNPVVRLFRKFVPLVAEYHSAAFTVRKDGRRFATPLLLVLVTIETTDVVFATDSIPAVLGITTDSFIVYTSNIFAILGLRSLFFVLSRMMVQFHHLRYGLAFILVFIGLKMLLQDVIDVPIEASLGVVAGLLGLSVLTSLLFPPRADAAR